MDLGVIKEIYGEEILETILDNMDIIEKNVKTLQELGFKESEELLMRYPSIFMNFPKQFRDKIDKLKDELGESFVEKIETDISIFEKLDNMELKNDK